MKRLLLTLCLVFALAANASAGVFDGVFQDTANISGGTIDGAVIGGTTPAAGTFTSVTTDTISEKTAAAGVTIDGITLKDGGALDITGGTNTFNVTNGTASLDVAAGATVNVDANLTVEAISVVNQDLSSDASPTFAVVNALKQVTTYSANGNVATTAMDGGFSVITGAYELELPTAVVGYDQTFYASTAAVYSLDLQTGTDVIVLNGTALTAGNKATSDGTIYNTLRVRCFVAGKYIINSLIGLAIDGGA